MAGLVPDWIQLPLIQGRVTPDILDVLRLRKNSLSCPVGLTNMPSAHLPSRPLRQVMYGLLLPGCGLNLNRPMEVEERDRVGDQLKTIPVQPTFTTVTKQLLLSSLDKVMLSSGDLRHFKGVVKHFAHNIEFPVINHNVFQFLFYLLITSQDGLN